MKHPRIQIEQKGNEKLFRVVNLDTKAVSKVFNSKPAAKAWAEKKYKRALPWKELPREIATIIDGIYEEARPSPKPCRGLRKPKSLWKQAPISCLPDFGPLEYESLSEFVSEPSNWNLKPRDMDMVKQRFGFDDGREKPYSELESIFKLSRGYIQNLVDASLRRILRHWKLRADLGMM